MKTVKIASKTSGLNVVSSNPMFRYFFEKKDVPLEIPEEHAEKILRNKDFYVSDKSVAKTKKVSQKAPVGQKPWLLELEEVKGIGEKTAKDIQAVYPIKGSLLEAISKKAHIPFDEDIVKLLKKGFIH